MRELDDQGQVVIDLMRLMGLGSQRESQEPRHGMARSNKARSLYERHIGMAVKLVCSKA